MGFPGGSGGKESACNAGDLGPVPGWEGPLEEGMAATPPILAWRMPWTEEPGRLQSMGRELSDTPEQLTLSQKLRAFKTVSSVQFSCSVVSHSLRPRGLQHASVLCPLPTPRACSSSYPLSR